MLIFAPQQLVERASRRAVRLAPRAILAWSALAALFWASGKAQADESLPLHGRRVAGLHLASGAHAVAHLDAANRIQYFVGQGEKWKLTTVTFGSPRLVPGAPLALVAGEGEELPKALTIDSDGRFVELIPGKAGPEGNSRPEIVPIAERLISSGVQFPPGGDFTIARRSKRSSIFAISRDGVLWEFDPQAGEPTKVEGRAGLLLPGGAVRSLRDAGDELFLIDRRGNLVSYIRDPVVRWKGPCLIGTGFIAGSDLVVWRRPDNKSDAQVAAVNASGELQVGRLEPNGWKMEMAPGWVLPPGTPIGVAHTPVNMRLCAVTARGTLQEMHLLNTEWRERTIGSGFAWRSSAVFLPNGPVAMGVDVAGNLISATHAEEVWSTFVTTTDPAVETTRLVQRTWKRVDDAPTIEVRLVNHSDAELSLGIGNRLKLAPPTDMFIAPSTTTVVTLKMPQDSAGDLEDLRRFTAADGTKTEQTISVKTMPQSLCDIEVRIERDEGVPYIDLRQNPWPPLRAKSMISLGSFAIPPGLVLPKSTAIDLVRSAETGRLSIVGP